jgi:putative Mg2+ transporter-C (MgtC) family protein
MRRMFEAPFLLFLLKLLTAGTLGVLVGVERQWHQGLAGMRTNGMVAIASAAFVSLPTLLPEDGTGPAHMANYIVTGIGFLGGGVILREGTSVRGLNTAATMWATAAVGALIGCGLFAPAVSLAACILVINVLLRPIVRVVNRLAAQHGGGSAMTYQIAFTCRSESVAMIKQTLLQDLDTRHLALRALRTSDENGANQMVSAEIIAYGPDDQRIETLVAGLSTLPTVTSASWSTQASAETDMRMHPGS